MMIGQYLSIHRIFVCAGWSKPLLVAHAALLEISCRGPYIFYLLAFEMVVGI